jgi:glutamine synthetase
MATETLAEPSQASAGQMETKTSLIDKGVKYCLASYVDVHGVPKAKAVPVDHFDRMMRGSELYTGAALDGLGQGPNDDELALYPDPQAVTVLPWEPTVAWAPGNLHYHNEPYSMCSRSILIRQIERAKAMGFGLNLGIECEIFLVRREGDHVVPANPKSVLPRAAYDVSGLLDNLDWLDETVSYMNQLGWGVYSFDHEDANSQYEFDFAYADVLKMADRYTLWKMMMKEVSKRHDIIATFMPKPYANRTGSGSHFNMSMESLATGDNIFGDISDKRNCGLSKIAYQFLAGVLQHAPAIVAVTCPIVNSYKRLVKTGSMTGYTWAPVFISYGGNNRTHMMRVPMLRPEIETGEGINLSSARIESRAVDPAMNVYLAAAMMLAAGLDGIENDLDPGDPENINMYDLSEKELAQKGVKMLPRTLLEAIEEFEKDPFTSTVLGEGLTQSYVKLKTAEWWDFHNAISSWEIEKYLDKF